MKKLIKKEKIILKNKVLLALLPYWTPQIPPLGISCLKSYLEENGFNVSITDLNTNDLFRDIYDKYFDILRGFVEDKKRGNFYNIGHEVMQENFMAYINLTDNTDNNDYIRLVKKLVYNVYYIHISEEQVALLHNIVIKFYNLLEQNILNLVENESPEYFGLSVYKGNLPASLFAFKLVKQYNSSITTIMGGGVFAQKLNIDSPDFEFFAKKTESYLDKMIIGEGELLFLKLLRKELSPMQRVFTLKDINYEIVDINKLPLPDYRELDKEIYPTYATYSSRSCPYQCNFCSETVYWGKFRKKKTSIVIKDLKKLSEIYNTQLFLFCDSLLNPILTELSHGLIKEDISIYWDGYLRVSKATSNRENAILWRQGGLYRVRLGIESGSQKVLKLMNKDISMDQIKSTLINIADAGIKTTTYWIIGYPGEEEEDFQKTLDLIEELQDYIYEAECNPFGYYHNGQVNSDNWLNNFKIDPMFSEKEREMLLQQTWILNSSPSREETFKRVSRFVEHSLALGIPNPYSLYDIYQADNRWKHLHKNAVPSIVEYKNNNRSLNENRNIKRLNTAENTIEHKIDFQF